MSEPVHRKVFFELEQDDDGYPPAAAESLWGLPTSAHDRFIIDNIPFFVDDVAMGDHVKVDNRNGQLWFVRLLKSGGHSSLRVFVEDEDEATRLRDGLAALGCPSERDSGRTLISIDLPSSVPYQRVVALLEEGEEKGLWEYFDGVVRHSL